MKTLRDRIDYILKQEDITRAKLAKKLGVSRSTVSYWMNREPVGCGIKGSLAKAIQDLYGYRIEWILEGEEPKTLSEVNDLQSRSNLGKAVKAGDVIDLSGIPDDVRHILQAAAAAAKHRGGGHYG